MQCMICKKRFRFLGGHMRPAHGIMLQEYRIQFGILLGTPLMDNELCVARSDKLKQLMADPDYKAEVVERCIANAKAMIGKTTNGMTDAGKKSLARHRSAPDDIASKRRLTRETGHPAARLTKEQAIAVASSESLQRITAAKFRIAQSTVSKLRNTFLPNVTRTVPACGKPATSEPPVT